VAKQEPVDYCALCGSENVRAIEEDIHPEADERLCVCPGCGHKQAVRRGVPCSHAVCEKCNSRMRRQR
jgi:DNA-directed RNA polymerase subunit RPC12/RpoP